MTRKATVPWLPWLEEEVPSGVVWLLKQIESLAVEMSRASGGMLDSVDLLTVLGARTELSDDSCEWYVKMAIEIGILGAVDKASGLPVAYGMEPKN